VIDWLARQVKQTRVEAARLALEEYDKWNRNPHGYIPPQGYDFPAYVIPPARSRQWLTTTPPPPVLANKSLLSFFAEIISSNGWSPLNNPLLTKGQRNTSLETLLASRFLVRPGPMKSSTALGREPGCLLKQLQT